MRILHFLPSLEVGGTEKMLITFLENKKNEDIEHTVCTIYDRGQLREDLKKLEIPYYTLDIGSKIFYPIAFIKFFFLIRKINPDIIHSYLLQDNLIARVAGRLLDKKVICGKRDLDRYKNPIKVFFDRITLGMADLHLSNSLAGVRELLSYGLRDGKVSYAPNGKKVNKEKVNREGAKISLGFSKRDVVIGIVARLYKYKGHEYAIRAMQTLPGSIKLVIVGDGTERKNLERITEDLGLAKRVVFLGERNDALEILNALDMFVLPSLREGLSGAIMEAMAAGLPVVAADIEENRELIEDGKTGLLIAPANADAINGAIRRLIRDKKLAASLGGNARIKIKNDYSIRKMVEAIESTYVKHSGLKH